jgi:SAM-dependent methyltransferase
MSVYKQAFGDVSGGVVLDLATGEGDFVQTLMDNLKSYEVFIGIDILQYTKSKDSVFYAHNVTFIQMDTRNLGFENQSFDSVSISSALHHLEEVSSCLGEMKRVLKPGGAFIIRETHQDVLTAPQRNDMDLHHWVAEIDTSWGYTHKKTFYRQEILALVEPLGLCDIACFDMPNTDLDPMDTDAIQINEDIIDRYLTYAQKLTGSRDLINRGETLRDNHHAFGVQWEPELIIRGYSPIRRSSFPE